MNELTDLEICRRIADIEGIHYMETRYVENNFLALVGENDFTGTPPEMIGEYNPLTDDSLCFQLMIKHRVELHYDENCNDKSAIFGAEVKMFDMVCWCSTANEDICLAIIEANRS